MQLSKLQTLDILEVFKHYNFDLKESGDRYVTRCVFHQNDNTPSLTIYPETNSFYCFSCHKSGDALTLISFMENISILEAKKLLGTDFLKYNLTMKPKKQINFFNALLKDSSNIIYNYLKAYPEKLDHTMKCMEQFDHFIDGILINKTNVDFTLYTKSLDNLKYLLYNFNIK